MRRGGEDSVRKVEGGGGQEGGNEEEAKGESNRGKVEGMEMLL